MSRRKQAKPRALKREDVDNLPDESTEDVVLCNVDRISPDEKDISYTTEFDSNSAMEGTLYDNSLETPTQNIGIIDIENSLESGLKSGVATPTSWRSTDTPDDQSMSPTSCANFSDADADLSYTIGVTENTPYACHFCNKAFPRQNYLKKHEQVHADHMPFKCDFCNRLFKHKRSRDRHIKLHTGECKYKCNQCKAAFSRSDHLKIHMKTHDNGKPYPCTVCNRGYNTAAALTSHMQNHKKEQNPSSPSLLHTFRCLQCTSVFATTKELQMHSSTHENEALIPEKTIQCSFCADNFSTTEHLKLHVESKHAPETQGKCPECNETFSSLDVLLQHKKVHEESTDKNVSNDAARFTCGFCMKKEEYQTLDALQKHVQESHVQMCNSTESSTTLASSRSSPLSNPRTTPDTHNRKLKSPSVSSYACEYCTMKFNALLDLQKHIVSVHSFIDAMMNASHESVYCAQCSKTFPNASQLADHERTMHEREINVPTERKLQHRSRNSSPRHPVMPEIPMFNGSGILFPKAGPLLCNQCPASLPDFEAFRVHLKCHIDSVITKYSCYECDGQFPSQEHLDNHMVKHFLSATTEYGCQGCRKKFVTPDQLQSHLMETHAHHLYQCTVCKEIFQSKLDVQLHFSMKHSNACYVYKCTSCNSIYRTDEEFKMHVKMAHMPKLGPFYCGLCNLHFQTDSELQIHYQSHKKFTCIYCREEFQVEFLLDCHIQEKHSTENVISFSHNDGECAQNLSLKSNSRAGSDNFASHSKKQLRCDMCDTSFAAESSLSAHRRQAHNIRTSGSQKSGQTTLSLICAYCNEPCKSRTELGSHMKAHGVSPSKHKCNICDEVCPSAGTLAEHKLAHCKVVIDSVCVTCHTSLKLEDQFFDHLHRHNPQGLPAPCVICRQTLMTEVEVQVHAKHHLKITESLHSCCVCGKNNQMQQLIITGTQDSHSYMCKDCFHLKEDGIRCFECSVKFENMLEFEKHQLTHRKTFQCIKCQLSFNTETEIKHHVNSHLLQEGTNHGCYSCNKIFDSPSKLQCHLIEHNFEGSLSFSCYMCGAIFTSSHLIQQHMLEHGLNSRPYDCELCHQKFFFKSELDNHVFFHSDSMKQNSLFHCTECSKTFSTLKNLHSHSKIHELKPNNNILKCSCCPEVFESSLDMQQHYFRIHKANSLLDNTNCFPCSKCDEVFPCKSNLQGHMRMHDQDNKFVCPECDKEFALSKNLKIHMRSHSGVKPYECQICNMKFARKENRKAHLKSHSGHKPFPCPHCGKTFARKGHVKEHMRIHITSTTHPCEVCTETFPSIADLKRHLVGIHNKQFDHTCSICNEVFESTESLDQHLLKEHDARTSGCNSSPIIDSESSMEQSSSPVDLKDLESSELSSNLEESDTRDSPMSIVDSMENHAPTSPTAT